MRRGLTLRVVTAGMVLAAIVGASFAVLLRAIFVQDHSALLATHSQEVLASANRLERLVVDLESGSRGYLLTGEEGFLLPWTAARKSVPGESANLRRLAEVPTQHERAVRVTSLIDSYIKDYSIPLVEGGRQGDPSVRSVATANEGRHRVDMIRSGFAELEAAEGALATARNASSIATAELAVAAAATGLGVSVLLIAGATFYLTRAIVRPVRRAARMADQLAGGDLSTRIPETSVGELGLLEHSFNQMGDSLATSRAESAQLLNEQAALRRVATLVARGQSPASVLTAVAEEAGTVLGVAGARVLRLESDGTATVIAIWGRSGSTAPRLNERVSLDQLAVTSAVAQAGRPAWRDVGSSTVEGTTTPGPLIGLGAPIVVDGRVWGVMVTLLERATPMPPDTEDRVSQFTDLVATAVANGQAREDLAASRARLVTASDEARHRIERDLHDGAQQRLVSLALDVRAAAAGVADQAELRDQLGHIAAGLTAALDDLREVSRGIHPAILSEGGLGPALRGLARRSAVPVELDTDLTRRPPPAVEIAVYYVVAEALTNATRHADASVIRIEAHQVDDRLIVSVADDGAGGADPAAGSGLVGLIDRIDALGGRITVVSPPGEGTTIRVELPTPTS
ncbi:MAG TPA: CHASE3 domain-containing protein [Pseudonocardiaceae bacterium]|nr:CHASE3 domain-containing protein [Pseudonocardiaceae bacterium]